MIGNKWFRNTRDINPLIYSFLNKGSSVRSKNIWGGECRGIPSIPFERPFDRLRNHSGDELRNHTFDRLRDQALRPHQVGRVSAQQGETATPFSESARPKKGS